MSLGNQRGPTVIKSGFSFIVTHVDVEGPMPVEIIQGHIFRQACPAEIETINSLFRKTIGISSFQWPRYDAVVREEKYEGRSSYHYEILPSDKWKYWVVAFEGTNVSVHRIAQVALLLDPDIDFGFEVYFTEPDQQGDVIGYSSLPLHLVETYSAPGEAFSNARTLRTDSLATISGLIDLQDELSGDHSFVRHAISNFSSIRRVPRSSELRVVGYFSIVESLITHVPRLTETLDSIGHQIRNKAILLRKRFERPIEPDLYFSPGTEQKLWKLLYSYRSSLAHGASADFKTTFHALKDHDTVVRFLKEFIKELLILALKDPEFISDLKQC